jgi:transcriptional regulator with XRE-family HTH domain
MDSRIGTILREARNRREISLAEVEAATRIRLRYLRAIESGEWDALPGGVYTRGFIRAYASFLGLDGERLANEYRREVEGTTGERGSGSDLAPAAAGGPRRPRRAAPRTGWLVVAAVVLVAVLVVVALPVGGGDDVTRQSTLKKSSEEARDRGPAVSRPRSSGVSVQLAASAEVWVCMLDASGQHLVNGQILEAGAQEGPFRSGSFTVSFGNGEVSMLIDGEKAEIAATSSPIGYSIDSSGRLTALSEAERPTCT